jgi:NAD(P)-dependent dehydrogenase (short-subunit alcohol dehydrogenase family)
MELAGKVALITGAGSGIGKASALRFASEGALIGVLSQSEDEVDQTVSEIERAGGAAVPLTCDVSDCGAVKAAVASLVAWSGGLDIVFANAGIQWRLGAN